MTRLTSCCLRCISTCHVKTLGTRNRFLLSVKLPFSRKKRGKTLGRGKSFRSVTYEHMETGYRRFCPSYRTCKSRNRASIRVPECSALSTNNERFGGIPTVTAIRLSRPVVAAQVIAQAAAVAAVGSGFYYHLLQHLLHYSKKGIDWWQPQSVHRFKH